MGRFGVAGRFNGVQEKSSVLSRVCPRARCRKRPHPEAGRLGAPGTGIPVREEEPIHTGTGGEGLQQDFTDISGGQKFDVTLGILVVEQPGRAVHLRKTAPSPL
jgi:hypothetical protein